MGGAGMGALTGYALSKQMAKEGQKQAKKSFHWVNEKYGELQQMLASDPLLKAMQNVALQAKKYGQMPTYNYPSLMKAAGTAGANKATKDIAAALAAGGGGNLSTALAAGSQARVGTAQQALMSGLSAQQNQALQKQAYQQNLISMLSAPEQFKWGTLTSMYGTGANFMGQYAPAGFGYAASMADLGNQILKDSGLYDAMKGADLGGLGGLFAKIGL